MQRLETAEDSEGETNGILVEWGEVRIADSCVQTLLKIRTLTNAMQKLLGGEIECHHTCRGDGRGANLELPNETRYGRLLGNTGMRPCLKRACVSLEEAHISIIGQMQIKGQEQKKLIEANEKAPGRERVELYHEKIESIIENAEKHSGLIWAKSKCRKKEEISTHGNSRDADASPSESRKGKKRKNNTIKNNGRIAMNDCGEQKKRRIGRENEGRQTSTRTTSGEGFPGKGKTERDQGTKTPQEEKN